MAALDFPFSTPRDFARLWKPAAVTMPDLWAAAAGLELAEFIALRNEFVDARKGLPARDREPKRLCDPPESYSCLHMVNPNMVPMTFYGMQLLHRLWTGDTANTISVPPLPNPSRPGTGPETVLLEVMPGAVLRRLGLPFKGYKRGVKAGELRRQILDELPQRAAPVAVDLSALTELCLSCDDALDSVVASIAAALWAIDPSRFPQPVCDPHSQLEGWLYAPQAE